MNPSIFDGDGRRKVQPINAPEGTKPVSVTRSQARRLTYMFDVKGQSNHSGSGNVLWVIITHCKEQDIPHRVFGRIGYGYEVRKLTKEPA